MHKEFRPEYPKFQEVVEQLRTLSDKLHAHILEHNPEGQVAIQTDNESVTDWTSGIGRSEKKTAEWEKQFRFIQPELKNTPVDEYINWLDIPVYRTRIMVSRPKSTYSIHRDYSPRLHLPLVTNRQCNFLITEPLSFFHLPADGKTYWVDTRCQHTFLNGSLDNRLHLVMIVEK